MQPFVRFIIVVLMAGALASFAIVVAANVRSQRRQAENAAAEHAQFQTLLGLSNDRLRRADIAVEWQKIDAHGQAVATSLLIRRYLPSNGETNLALPLVRVEIPGSHLNVDGLSLEFGPAFSDDVQEFQLMRNIRLLYFAHVYGDGEEDADRYSFMRTGEVPELTRIHPERKMPTFYETRLWQRVWDWIPDPAKAANNSLKVAWIKPASREVTDGHVYSAFLGNEGVSLDEASTPGLLNGILQEADQMKAAADAANAP